jgi:hypothetical protein
VTIPSHRDSRHARDRHHPLAVHRPLVRARGLADLESVENASVTDNWTKSFPRNGVGPMPAEEHAGLHRIVDTAHG